MIKLSKNRRGVMEKHYDLDDYEQEIEDNYEKSLPIKNQEALKKGLEMSAKTHLNKILRS
jgi:hypothetical protein